VNRGLKVTQWSTGGEWRLLLRGRLGDHTHSTWTPRTTSAASGTMPPGEVYTLKHTRRWSARTVIVRKSSRAELSGF